jgi:hypothetical protein
VKQTEVMQTRGPWEAWQLRLMSALASPRLAQLMPYLVSALAFVVYLFTMAPRLTWEHAGRDGGDFITAAWVLGVPHPTGYPTYTLLAALFARLPFGSVAWRVHLLSGVAAAATVWFVYVVGRRLTAQYEDALSVLGAAVGALLLAFAPLFWGHALIAEVYTLHLFFIALILWLMLRWRAGQSPLPLAALVFGLGMGNHITLSFMAPAVLLLLWSGRRQLSWRGVLLSVPALLAGLLVYLYLPWRASHNPIINWGNPDSWENFYWVVTGRGYEKFFFALPLNDLGSRLAQWWGIAVAQFPFLAWPLAALGWWELARRDRCLALGTGFHAGFSLIYSIFYNTTDAFVYMLPLFLYAALWMGQGAAVLLDGVLELSTPRRAVSFLSGVAIAALVLLPIVSLVEEWDGMDLTHDRVAAEFATEVLDTVEADALILVGADAYTFALWYYHYVEDVRPDVAIVNYAMMTFEWYRDLIGTHLPEIDQPPPANSPEMKLGLALRNVDDRPVYLAKDEDPPEALDAVDVGRLWRVTRP